MTVSALPGPAEVLEFWFGDPDGPHEARAEWFRKDPAFDARIRDRFGPLIEATLAAPPPPASDDPRQVLARIVVLDQFTRNAYRDTPRAFAGDAMALQAARELVGSGADRRLSPVMRWFAYLPFEHSESLADQDESVRLFATLCEDPLVGSAYEWAVRHREVIERFGRFPHRNAILGRVDSVAEREFLAQPGSRF